MNTPFCQLRAGGFSLLEITLVLALIALLISTAAPNFGRLLAQQQLRSVGNEFLYAVRATRSHAIKQQTRVSLCPLHPNTVDCSNQGAWQYGWQAFVDSDANGEFNGNEQLLHRYSSLGNNFTITGNRYVKTYLSFTAAGDSRRAQGQQGRGSLQLGTFKICSTHPALIGKGYAVVISRGGRPRLDVIDSC